MTTKKSLPTLFFSHGGPTFMYENDPFGNKGAWNTLRKLGAIIRNEWKPDYIVVVSAHWQSEGPNQVDIASPNFKDGGENSLIYDFYNFPKHMYEETFHSYYSSSVAHDIQKHLVDAGFQSNIVDRGFDHGVWVPLKVAFKEGLDKDIPLFQVSLTSDETDFGKQFKLGKALHKLKEDLDERGSHGLIICSGMTVHNLKDFRRHRSNGFMKAEPYVAPFHELLKKFLYNDKSLLSRLTGLKTDHTDLLYRAHPTLEHFVPLVVAGGTIGDDLSQPIEEVYNDEAGSLGWGVYRFGNLPE